MLEQPNFILKFPQVSRKSDTLKKKVMSWYFICSYNLLMFYKHFLFIKWFIGISRTIIGKQKNLKAEMLPGYYSKEELKDIVWNGSLMMSYMKYTLKCLKHQLIWPFVLKPGYPSGKGS